LPAGFSAAKEVSGDLIGLLTEGISFLMVLTRDWLKSMPFTLWLRAA
jgi:hypothetical protein